MIVRCSCRQQENGLDDGPIDRTSPTRSSVGISRSFRFVQENCKLFCKMICIQNRLTCRIPKVSNTRIVSANSITDRQRDMSSIRRPPYDQSRAAWAKNITLSLPSTSLSSPRMLKPHGRYYIQEKYQVKVEDEIPAGYS